MKTPLKILPLLCLLLCNSGVSAADQWLSPQLHVAHANRTDAAPHVALTLDLCSGATDERILSVLVEERIKATLFVTARWIKRNPKALATLLQHPDLFQIENHGARHLIAVDQKSRVFGVATAGSLDAVRKEVADGAAAIKAATGRKPEWFRGAAALYTANAIQLISSMHMHVAGYSLSGDGGATYSAGRATRAISNAKDGDVIIAHMNQPQRPAGAGVVQGIKTLAKAGYVFVRLDGK